MALDAAAGRELDWVFVLGLASARMPGARMRAAEPIPDALLRETLGPDDRGAHVASMRRLLHVAMTRASRGLVLAYPARAASGAVQPPSPFAEEARAGSRRGVGAARGGAVRPRGGAARDVSGAARRAAGGRRARRQGPGRPAPGHRPRRHARRRALPRARQARGADRAPGGAVGGRGAGARQRAPRRIGVAAAARGAADLDARRAAARRRARRPRPRRRASGAQRAVADRVPAAARRGARAVGVGHRDLPRVPAALQVRARAARAAGADAQPALRDPRAPGARALPPGARRLAARHPRPARRRVAEARLRRLRRGAPAAREGFDGAAPLPPADRRRARRAGLVRARVLVSHGRAHAARPRRPRRPAGRRRLRADRLQDRPPALGGGAEGGRAAIAVRRRRARGVAARCHAAVLPLRARRPEGARALRRHRRSLDRRHRRRGRRRNPRAGLRADPVARGLLDVRLTASPARRPSAEGACPR